MPLSSSYVWFLQALNVINAVLDLHRHSLRLGPLISRADAELGGCNLVVAITDDLAGSRSVDYVTIRFQQGRFVLVSHARTTPRTDWRVFKSALLEVAKNPRPCFDDPDRLDLDWLHECLASRNGRDAAADDGADSDVPLSALSRS
jgi:hypothetical protein